jgi:hypothetical protein
MLSSFWNWFVIILTVGSILGCWWLLHWTKGISGRKDGQIGSTGHVWDENLVELNAPLPRWWLHLFNITIVFALVYMALFPGLGNLPGVLDWTQVKRYDAEVAKAEQVQQVVYARFSEMSPEQLMTDTESTCAMVRTVAAHPVFPIWRMRIGSTAIPGTRFQPPSGMVAMARCHLWEWSWVRRVRRTSLSMCCPCPGRQ